MISALQAGADMILMPDDLDKAVKAVVQAVNHKQISESRLDTSLRRILRVKTQRL
ncbi:glycoside hydrolase family 3 N-terminal domain-containing protein [Levyella massiliensis]|uniref:glycoside hydrolase family 3 N-terminal domain-containing protein n=1 Tax=Levyella massiliensis TaxID=938289 RepID=UPI00399B0915